MRHKLLIGACVVGIAMGLASAYFAARRHTAQPPLFVPAANPYKNGIYANGIVESSQSNGENINIYPEISGPITSVKVIEGQTVHRDQVLLTVDDSVQRATAEQLKAQAQAANALLEELQAQPRPENLAIAKAQVESAKATLKNTTDTLAKREAAHEQFSGAVSQDELDTDRNAVSIAKANLNVAQKQLDLVQAGAWSYDIRNQEKNVIALTKAYDAAMAIVNKYTLLAPTDGVILSIQATVGSYVSPQGGYDTYTGGFFPLIVMGAPQDHMQVRCYVDEILLHRLPVLDQLQTDNESGELPRSPLIASMFIRGTNISIPLTFERVQPYVSPKIELSNQRREQVDVRVLPVIFRFDKPKNVNVYPGQLVDVYIGVPEKANVEPASSQMKSRDAMEHTSTRKKVPTTRH